MKNIPVFTTELGIASLTLQEIPYKQQAYIRIQSSVNQSQFIKECVDFCYAVGAEKIYITGDRIPEQFPLFTRIIKLACERSSLPETDSVLIPVTVNNIDEWRCIYNKKMKNVPCSATLSIREMEKFLTGNTLYYVNRGSDHIGIGKISDNQIDVIASCVPGAGKDVILALSAAVKSETIYVEVADMNIKALNLYKSLGFLEVSEVARWYSYK